MFDALKRGADDNPTLGIILCTDKSETVVKYLVLRESQQILTSKYKNRFTYRRRTSKHDIERKCKVVK